MTSTSPVALILGAGANVGQHVGRAFAAKGYRIALASRSLKEGDSSPSKLHIQGDFSDPASITEIFAKVKSQLGTPSVVVYNGIVSTFLRSAKDLLTRGKSFRRDSPRQAESTGSPSQRLQPGLHCEWDQCFRSGSASRARLRAAARVSITDFHLYGQLHQCRTHRGADGQRRWQDRHSPHHPMCSRSVQGQGLQVRPERLSDLMKFINHLAGSTTPMKGKPMARPCTVPLMDQPMPNSTLSLLREPHRGRGSRPLSRDLDTRSFRL